MSENKFVFVKNDERVSEQINAPLYSYWKSVFRTFLRNKTAVIMLVVSLIVVAIAFIQPMFSHYDPLSTPNINDFSMRFLPPSSEFLFGTDNVGNSLFDVVWAGTRTSLMVAGIATTINMVIGVAVGAFWGYSKKIDKYLIELYNVVANVPFILLAMILMYVLGRGMWQLIFSLTVTGWLSVAYFIRTQVMMIRDREYNLASRCLGTPMKRMVTKNILPYMVSVIMTLISREIPNNISMEVFLSFLGIGMDATTPSIGRTISNYTSYMNGYPHLFWIPVGVLAIVSISLYVVGQTLADASDPRTHM